MLYTPKWNAAVAERYGRTPVIEWLESPIAVDNVTGRIIVEGVP